MSVLGVVGGIVSSIFGNNSAKKEAERNREFQERMARNAHQYEVEDLKKAGLNPILSGLGGSGAATPSGAVANIKPPDFSGLLTSAKQREQANEQIKVLQETARKTKEEADKAGYELLNTKMLTNLNYSPAEFLDRQVRAGTASNMERSVWAQQQNLIADTIQKNTSSALAEENRKYIQKQSMLLDPTLDFNAQTANSAQWIKTLMEAAKLLKK